MSSLVCCLVRAYLAVGPAVRSSTSFLSVFSDRSITCCFTLRAGTCKMGTRSDKSAVVDENLRVCPYSRLSLSTSFLFAFLLCLVLPTVRFRSLLSDHIACLLQVIGVKGLRVADCSIMPTLPSGNTNAPAVCPCCCTLRSSFDPPAVLSSPSICPSLLFLI